MTAADEARIKRRHHSAMNFCERAIVARSKREYEAATALFRKAFVQEREAAGIAASESSLEPTRSVLHRSAASLALECGEFREAEKLVATALSGEPPDEIAEELRDLLEQANLERHLALKGIVLQKDEFQLSIDGRAIGHGMAESNEFIDRVQTSEKLILRTVERMMGISFREAGKAIKKITQNAELYLSIPRAASFAVTLRIGLQQKQMGFPTIEQEIQRSPGEIIDELFDCLESFQRNDVAKLKQLIPDDTYRRNFVALAERLGPDGDKVKVVGLTAVRPERERKVTLVKRHVEERVARKPPRETVSVTGTLLLANSTRATRPMIRIVDANGTSHNFKVPDGMMVDIVKPLYEERVLAIGVKRGKSLRLKKIDKSPD